MRAIGSEIANCWAKWCHRAVCWAIKLLCCHCSFKSSLQFLVPELAMTGEQRRPPMNSHWILFNTLSGNLLPFYFPLVRIMEPWRLVHVLIFKQESCKEKHQVKCPGKPSQGEILALLHSHLPLTSLNLEQKLGVLSHRFQNILNVFLKFFCLEEERQL